MQPSCQLLPSKRAGSTNPPCVPKATVRMGPGPSEAPTPRMFQHRAPYKTLHTHAGPDPTIGTPRATKRQQRGHRGPEQESGAIPGYVWPRHCYCLDSRKERRPANWFDRVTTPTLRIANAADRRPEPRNTPSPSPNRRLATGWRRGKLVGSKLNGATGAAAPAPPNGQSER